MSLPENLILDQFPFGPWGNFMYFIGDASTKEVAIVDPAWDAQAIHDHAEANGYKIISVLLTHGHSDHVSALDALLAMHDVPAYISKQEHPSYMPQHKSIVHVVDKQIINVGSIDITCVSTPGHTPGCVCFMHKNILLTGDTLFIDGCGRCDLTGGDPSVMYDTLYNILLKLPEETVIYTGHQYGPKPFDTLAEQKKTNPYLQCTSKDEFLTERM